MPRATLIIFSLKFKSFIASLSSLRWRYPSTALKFGSISCRAVPNPSLPLSTVFPVTQPNGVNPHLTHDILDTVGSLEADTELWKHTQMVKGLCFFHNFFQATNSRLIEDCQFSFERVQLLLRRFISGLFINQLKFSAKVRLMFFSRYFKIFSRLCHWQRWITAFSEKAFLIPNVVGTSLPSKISRTRKIAIGTF
jgi:hypothetical protein